MCEKAFSTKRISSLLAQVWFYSLTVASVSILALGAEASATDIISAVFPTVFAEYWFFTAYIVLLLISPFINRLIDTIDRPTFTKLLICLIALWSVIPTLTTKDMYGTEIPQFVLLYLVGAYLKKYPDNFLKRKPVRILMTAVSLSLMILSVVAIDLVTALIDALAPYNAYATFFLAENSILTVACATGLFSIAAYGAPFSCKWVNLTSSCVFGVYLIHDHPLLRSVLWTELINVKSLYASPIFPLYAILIVLAIFVCAALVELARLKTIAAPMSKGIDKLLGCMARLINRITKS